MSRSSILFVTPPYHCGVVEVAGTWMPLTFAYLAGAAREAGWKPRIYDAMSKRHDHAAIEARLAAERPTVVATTAITSTIEDALEVLRSAKRIEPGILTILGGVHPTFCFKEILSDPACPVDVIIRGEGEETLRELLRALSDGEDLTCVAGLAYRHGGDIRCTPPRPLCRNLDTLRPAWDLIDWADYTYYVIPGSRLAVISSSRGCNQACTFCSQQKFWERSWRGRDPEKVAEEIVELHQGYGVNVFLIADEYPTQDQARWERFLDILIQRDLGVFLLMETRVGDIVRDADILWKYRRAGIIHIYVGIEATDQATLDLIHKDLDVAASQQAIRLIHQHGMITETSFVLGFPHETKTSIRRTLRLAQHYNPDFAHFLAITPWPYADMYRELNGNVAVHDYRKYNLIDPIIKPNRMTLAEVDRAIVDCYRKFYMGKIKEVVQHPDPFKRRYLLTSMQLIMRSSFLTSKLGSLGQVPARVEQLLANLT